MEWYQFVAIALLVFMLGAIFGFLLDHWTNRMERSMDAKAHSVDLHRAKLRAREEGRLDGLRQVVEFCQNELSKEDAL